jgi:hypothetical protein
VLTLVNNETKKSHATAPDTQKTGGKTAKQVKRSLLFIKMYCKNAFCEKTLKLSSSIRIKITRIIAIIAIVA